VRPRAFEDGDSSAAGAALRAAGAPSSADTDQGRHLLELRRSARRFAQVAETLLAPRQALAISDVEERVLPDARMQLVRLQRGESGREAAMLHASCGAAAGGAAALTHCSWHAPALLARR